MSEKLVKKCPVCGSSDICQDEKREQCGVGTAVILRNGSHCNNCGIMLYFNHLSEEGFEDARIAEH